MWKVIVEPAVMKKTIRASAVRNILKQKILFVLKNSHPSSIRFEENSDG